MTLIFSHISPLTGLLVGSDILTSVPEDVALAPVTIPFREEPLAHTYAGDALAGLAQKSVIFGRTMMSWAGSRIFARAIVQAVVAGSQDGQNEVDLHAIINGLGLAAAELESTAVIYHFDGGNPWIERKEWGAQAWPVEHAPSLIAAGTGTWNFFDNLSVSSSGTLPPHEEVIAQVLSKIAAHAVAEHAGVETLNYMYGGWFELVHRSAEGFAKLSYGVRLWARREKVLFSGGPGLINWYRNGNLNITTIRKVEVDGKERLESDNLLVPDMLGRGPSGPPEMEIRPTFMVHIVMDLDHGYQAILIDHEQSHGDTILVSPAGVQSNVPPALRQKLLEIKPGPAGTTIRQIH